jgi:undecaprenyl-diphosphatase
VAALMIAAIACSRVVLGVHYTSDVVGGVLVGLAWTAACAGVACAVRAGRGGG